VSFSSTLTARGLPATDVVRVGIDENGLGPRLGPLIVTAVTARTEGKGDAIATSSPRGALAARIGDSKQLVSFGDSALGEAWARVLAPKTAGDGPLDSPDALVHALSIDPRATLERPCPADHQAQCWGTSGESFDAADALLTQLRRDKDALRERGVAVLGAHVAIVCTERLNDAAARGISRFQADLFAMERLILHVRERYDCEVDATCGKVGGYNSYPAAFGPLAGRLFTTIEEGRARSAYRIANVGHVSFVRDADSGHLLVALASLVGKWVRDLLLRRVTRYHRAYDPKLPEASGYHDPITTRFIEASALARKERGVRDQCFERRALGVRRG
jgi:ribonuclease HII